MSRRRFYTGIPNIALTIGYSAVAGILAWQASMSGLGQSLSMRVALALCIPCVFFLSSACIVDVLTDIWESFYGPDHVSHDSEGRLMTVHDCLHPNAFLPFVISIFDAIAAAWIQADLFTGRLAASPLVISLAAFFAFVSIFASLDFLLVMRDP